MLKWLTDEIRPRPLAMARILVGTAALIRVFVAWPVLSKLVEPTTLKAPYFDWTPEPTQGLAIALLSIWAIAAVAFILGWKTPVSGLLLLASLVSFLLLDMQLYANHLYLMSWLVLLLVVADAGAALSVSKKERPVTRWPVLLLMMQVSIVYGFAGVTKINEDFLSGRVLAGVLRDGVVAFPDALKTPRFMAALATAAVITELFIAVFLWFPSFRPAAFILGLGLHGSIILFMPPTVELIVFALELLALYPLFLDHERLVVAWDSTCARCERRIGRFQRMDVLQGLTLNQGGLASANGDPHPIEVRHPDEVTHGFPAVTRVLERLVPTLWIAPLLRLPGFRHLGQWWWARA